MSHVTLAEDHRARVPFALVGVLLLVGSAVLSASLVGDPTPRTDESVGTAMERTTAATNAALHGAVTRAGRRAASAPVTAPANTSIGRVLNDSTPYRDYLRIRIYLSARESLDSVAVRASDVRGSVSLPATTNTSALRSAKRRVEIDPAADADESGLRVRIENVTVTAHRGGRIVERERLSPTLTVATPALALHARTERFETRLNRGPLAPGLGRRLTARLSAVAWARGYAQYGGAPITNVVANRHVELATNGALLREQRVAFGRSDPRGRRALAWATARTGVRDLFAGLHAQRGTERTEALLAAANQYQTAVPMPGGVVEPDGAGREVQVGVNRTADRAFAALLTDANGTDLADVLRSAYAIDARLVAEVRRTRAESRPALEPPESSHENWTLEDSRVTTTLRVENASVNRSELSLGTPPDWHLLDAESRRVVRTHALVANWSRGDETRRTVQRWSEQFAVRVGVAGNHSTSVAPTRPIAGVHERSVVAVSARGRPLAGPNLEDVAGAASERLVENRGGFDALARRAVRGTLDARSRRIGGQRPADLREWVYRDLVALRERVRNVSASVSPRSMLGGRPPVEKLAREIRRRRAELVDASEQYSGVADRARIAARGAYLDRVVAHLDSRAERATERRPDLGRALADAGQSLDRVRRILRERTTPGTPSTAPLPAGGPGESATLAVTGGPPYLTLSALGHEQVEAVGENESYHPLGARNVNVFAVPYGDAADAVVSTVGDGERADLRTAALALRAANRTLAERENATLERRRDALQGALAESMARVEDSLVAELSFGLTRAERRTAVRAGLSRWPTTAGRALAVVNGSASDAIASALVRQRPALAQAHRRDWVLLRATLAVETARRQVAGPPQSLVNRTGTRARALAEKLARRELGNALGNATEYVGTHWFGDVLGSAPAGLPVAPVPGYWFATLNVWHVSVRGQYARFSVRALGGPPNESVVYARQSTVVALDVDDDGDPEALGRTEPISFDVETAVVVVVPPGARGVGDRDGNRDERSPGWTPSARTRA